MRRFNACLLIYFLLVQALKISLVLFVSSMNSKALVNFFFPNHKSKNSIAYTNQHLNYFGTKISDFQTKGWIIKQRPLKNWLPILLSLGSVLTLWKHRVRGIVLLITSEKGRVGPRSTALSAGEVPYFKSCALKWSWAECSAQGKVRVWTNTGTVELGQFKCQHQGYSNWWIPFVFHYQHTRGTFVSCK